MKIKNILIIMLTFLMLFSFANAMDFENQKGNPDIINNKIPEIVKNDFKNIKNDIQEKKIKKVIKEKDKYITAHGLVRRKDIDKLKNVDLKIKDKLISVKNYNKSINDTFEVVLYTGNSGVDYNIKWSDKFDDYEQIELFGEVIGSVTSHDGFVTYNTSMFSTQILTLPDAVIYYPLVSSLWLDNYFSNYQFVEAFYYDDGNKISLNVNANMGETTLTDTSGSLELKLTRVDSEGFLGYIVQLKAIDDSTFIDTNYYIKVCEDTTGQVGCITRSAKVITFNDNSPPLLYNNFDDPIEINYGDDYDIIFSDYFSNYDRACILIDTFTICVDRFENQEQTLNTIYYDITLQSYTNGIVYAEIEANDDTNYYTGNIDFFTFNTDYSTTIDENDVVTLEIGTAGAAPSINSMQSNIYMDYNDYRSVNINNIFNNYDDIILNVGACTITSPIGSGNLEQTCTDNGVEFGLYPSDNYIILSIDSNSNDYYDTITLTASNDYGNTDSSFLVNVTEFVTASGGLNDELLAYYKFDTDASEIINNYDGTLEGGALVQSTTVINNGAVEVSGASQYIDIPDSIGDFTGAQDFSISYWIRAISFPADSKVIALYEDSSIRNYFKGDNLYFNIYNGGSYQIVSSDLSLNTWYHVTAVFDSGVGMELYIDGVSQGTATLTDTSLSSASGINELLKDGSVYFNGFIDELAIYQKKLSLAEVEQLHNSGSGSFYPFSTTGLPLLINHNEPVTINNTISDIELDMNDYIQLDTHLYFNNYDRILFQLEHDGTVVGREIEFISSEYQTLEINDTLFTLINTNNNIYMTIESGELGQDKNIIMTAYNDNFSSSQEFNLLVDGYFNPVNSIIDLENFYINQALNSQYTQLMNDYFINYEYITMDFEDTFTTEEFSFNISINDLSNYSESYERDGYYNITAYNDDGHIKINYTSFDNEMQDEINILLTGCNPLGCKTYFSSVLSGYYITSVNGTTSTGGTTGGTGSTPDWLPEPDDEYKPFYALLILIAVTFFAGFSYSRDSILTGAIFGIIAFTGTFLMLTYMGWIPIVYLVILMLIVAGAGAYMIKGMVS